MKITAGLSEGQVLQRLGTKGADVLIAGEAREDEPIAVTISQGNRALPNWNARPVGKSSKGLFKIKLSGIPSGGPYKLTLAAGTKRAAIRAFYVGDVWVMAGQSNMQGYGNLDQPATPHPLIRVFSMRREWRLAKDPLHVLGESPDSCHNDGQQISVERGEMLRKDSIKGVGAGLFFARDVLARTDVPQGLIATSHGGTSMEQWNPEHKKNGGDSLYYSMCESVRATGQPVAGVLWYQGESDALESVAGVYVAAMKKLVAATRRDFRSPRLPWVVVQLGRTVRGGDPRWWNTIREHQRGLPSAIRRLETVPAIDLPLDDNVHIGSEGFPLLGARMASAAARLALGGKGEMRPPQLRKIHSLRRDKCGCYLDVEFDQIQGGLKAVGMPRGFSLANAEHQPDLSIYRISLRGNIARLHIAGEPTNELKVGYGLGFDPTCTITDGRGSSLPAFGPLAFDKEKGILPFVTTWRKTPILPANKPLDRLACLAVKNAKHEVKSYETGGFINEFADWKNQPGQVFFSCVLKLPEAMKLRFLMGYDGPFRLWVNGKPLFLDLKGTNPCIPDEGARTLALRAGKHTVTVAMDTNEGRAWGFFLRFERMDVSVKEKREGTFVRPEYLV